MPDDVLARSFELIGGDYDRYRPGFPEAAASAIIPERVTAVLDLGAGTGKFTEMLARRAERIVAVEPSERMIQVLRSKLPEVESWLGTAEHIPLADASMQVVTVAQAFHWFDRDVACTEIKRVLVDGGTLGLVWNHADPTCAWDRACHRIAHPAVTETDATTDSADSALPGFLFTRHEEVRWVERLTREHYLRRWSTVSTFLTADDETAARMSSAIEAVLDDAVDTRGRDEFDLPHVTDVYIYRSD
ncbi:MULTISPECIES: class I SAM-dependent methyltransferase [unclassified Microbacterium]|uniref:class I SAM-dependent methyltransferase n=1 Tax=unclassified Microbacterium TaxID=2609290 RepID=UPI001605039F|nr:MULTISPECIES: class I SAM-dependent methyltransferase [unclassified Microbacterium]QNA92538.1 class I SAM-dependent methyltransferase [Microbacterium sp. Se63.02b]QYM65835.1 class I SAM-dependent methyltransferase [Microbacterium sp. Se5.02b]